MIRIVPEWVGGIVPELVSGIVTFVISTVLAYRLILTRGRSRRGAANIAFLHPNW